MPKIRLLFLLSALFALSAVVPAETLTFSLHQNVTDNMFQSVYAEPDRISVLSFSADKALSGLALFTQGNLSHVHDHPDMSLYTHDIGLDYVIPVGVRSALYLSLTGRGAFYRSDFQDFNYLSTGIYAAYKGYLRQTSIFKADYALEYRNHRQGAFDFLSHNLRASLDKYFQSRTTLQGELAWGYKRFIHPYIESAVDPGNSSAPGGNPHSYGKGKGNPNGEPVPLLIPEAEADTRGIQYLSLKGVVAQGLSDHLGLRLTAARQWILSGENPFRYIEEFYLVENPTYDRFSWEGFHLDGEVTALIPWNLQLRIGYHYSKKTFPGIESLNLDGDPLGIVRRDNRHQLAVRMEKSLADFSIFIEYAYIRNRSGDPYFDWCGQFLSVGVNWNLVIGESE